MSVFVVMAKYFTAHSNTFVRLAVAVAGGAVVYVWSLIALRVKEVREVIK